MKPLYKYYILHSLMCISLMLMTFPDSLHAGQRQRLVERDGYSSQHEFTHNGTPSSFKKWYKAKRKALRRQESDIEPAARKSLLFGLLGWGTIVVPILLGAPGLLGLPLIGFGLWAGGIVLGIIGLFRIKRKPELKGKKAAILGLILCGVLPALLFLSFVLFCGDCYV